IYSLYRHKNFSTAKFILSCATLKDKKYELIMQIIEYDSGNFSRSLLFCTKTYTSLFYEALACYKLKEYNKAISALDKILEKKYVIEPVYESKLNELVLQLKIELVYELLGDVYKEMCDIKKASKMYKNAFEENFYLKNSYFNLQKSKQESFTYPEKKYTPSLNLAKFYGGDFDDIVQNDLNKKIDIPYANLELKENNVSNLVDSQFKNLEDKFWVSETSLIENDSGNLSNIQTQLFFEDLKRSESKMNQECKIKDDFLVSPVENIIKNFYNDLQEYSENFLKYKSISPGFGTYFLKEYATFLAELGQTNEAIEIFDYILANEKIYEKRMDVYSSLLYKKRDKDKLANISRKSLRHYFDSSITWTVLGNYYSLNNNTRKALSCLEKSLYIKYNFYTVNLVGHEYIHKKEFERAKGYFYLSLLLEPDNYNALVGLGISHFHTQQPEAGLFYLKKAISLVPVNIFIRYILIKCTLKEEMYEECILALEDTFKIKGNKSKENRLITLCNHLLSCKREFNEYEEMIFIKIAELCLKLKLVKLAKEIISLVKSEDNSFKRVMMDISVEENRIKE
ncbi:nuclear scaffolding protein, partial [Tubulinosema ratisbonensis]